MKVARYVETLQLEPQAHWDALNKSDWGGRFGLHHPRRVVQAKGLRHLGMICARRLEMNPERQISYWFLRTGFLVT